VSQQKLPGKVKRKSEAVQVSQPISKKTKLDIVVSQRGLSHGYPLEHPYNKDGYRYILAEKDPHSSIVLDREEMAGRPIPPEVYRPWISPLILWSLNDRAPQIKVQDNRLTVIGDKGYCMIRATHGVSQGAWYYEINVDDLSCDGSCLRIGWSQHLATLQAPCGFDKLSYSWRSKRGTSFHQSRGKHYSDGYGEGDVLGFYIYLPADNNKNAALLPPTYKDKALIKFKNFFYFEEKDKTLEEFEKTLGPAKGSKIVMYKNGICQGTAYTDIYKGVYYPSVSLYKGAVVTANFGPSFRYPPSDAKYKPMCDIVDITSIRQSISEILFHVESKVLSRTTAQYPASYKFTQMSS
jgi:Set1/Ash2 histone methyltransferase complex subunit ASH2